MDQLIELLKQIQELAGVAIDALTEAGAGGGGEGGAPPEGAPAGPPAEGEAPPEGAPPA
jgi:hypothetical protein